MKAPDRHEYPPCGDRGDPLPELRMLIVSESDHLSREAMQTCSHLMATFDGNFVYHIAMGSFATLEVPFQFGQYLQASHNADMIFCVSDRPLPVIAMRWIKDCIQQHEEGDFALVDMTAEGLMASVEIKAALKSCRERMPAELIRQRWSSQRSLTTTSSTWHIARPCHGPHFGINE